MNIAFWSNVAGRSATSGNMLAVGIMTSVLYSLNTVMVQTDVRSKPIEEIFEGRRNDYMVHEDYSFYNRKGMNEIIDRSKLNLLNRETVETNMVNIKQTSLYYIPTARGDTESDSVDSVNAYQMLMELLNDISDVNMWDLSNGSCLSSNSIIDKCDVAVINISPDPVNISLPNDERILNKAVFLIGKYDGYSRKSVKQICREYGISKREVGVIPYNIRFHDAIYDGKAVPFIMKNIFSKKQDANFDFINSLFKATNIILRKAEVKGIE